MTIDELKVDPQFLEETRRAMRVAISAADRAEFALAETEWFCRECGALLEDELEPCECLGALVAALGY
jgi:rubrerythrin